jgi:hypothetical protein
MQQRKPVKKELRELESMVGQRKKSAKRESKKPIRLQKREKKSWNSGLAAFSVFISFFSFILYPCFWDTRLDV